MSNRRFIIMTMVLSIVMLHGCMNVPKPTIEELHSLDSPSPAVTEKIDVLFPKALSWYQSVESEYYSKGRPLSETKLTEAHILGITDPSRVRVVVLEQFPLPSDPQLLQEAIRFGLGSWRAGGRCHGYVILLKPRVADKPEVLAHELVHVSQQDRMGREAFLRRYLIELETLGYARSPLELEAYEKQRVAK